MSMDHLERSCRLPMIFYSFYLIVSMNFLRISVVTSIIVSSMMSAAFAATGEYTPNIWDHRTLQKVETRLDQFAKNGEKEMLIYIVGRTSV